MSATLSPLRVLAAPSNLISFSQAKKPPAPGQATAPKNQASVDIVAPAAPGKGTTSYRAAIYHYIAQERADYAARGLIQTGPSLSFSFFHDRPGDQPSKGLAVIFHGFSAGTAQWKALAQRAFAAGYDVFVPALPGHGARKLDQAGQPTVVDYSLVPNATEGTTLDPGAAWGRFANEISQLVEPAGNVAVVGLSAGADVAALMSEAQASKKNKSFIKGSFLVSMFGAPAGNYSGTPVKNSTVSNALRWLHDAFAIDPFLPPSGLLAETAEDSLLAKKIYDMGPPPIDPDTSQAITWGFQYPNYDNLLALTSAGAKALAHLDELKGQKVHFVVSQADTLADPSATIAAAKKAGFTDADMTIFPASMAVKHACSDLIDNPTQPQVVAQIEDAAMKLITESLSPSPPAGSPGPKAGKKEQR